MTNPYTPEHTKEQQRTHTYTHTHLNIHRNTKEHRRTHTHTSEPSAHISGRPPTFHHVSLVVTVVVAVGGPVVDVEALDGRVVVAGRGVLQRKEERAYKCMKADVFGLKIKMYITEREIGR